MKLKDWAPREFMGSEYELSPSRKYSEIEVAASYGGLDELVFQWPGPQKNVMCWCRLVNGIAVGWNESPSHGWSFPCVKLSSSMLIDIYTKL